LALVRPFKCYGEGEEGYNCIRHQEFGWGWGVGEGSIDDIKDKNASIACYSSAALTTKRKKDNAL
jgi:hypothetical protein